MKDLHTIWKHRWITPKAKAYKSPIHGLGVVAIKPIRKGEVVGVLGGIIVPRSEIGKYHKKMDDVGVQVNDRFFIVPTTRKDLELTGVFNHSCEPNVGYTDSITLIAIRNIRPSEELVFDYAFSESFDFKIKCNCGSKNCRKVVTGNDWKIKSIQKKYSRYFSPYLKRKIKMK